jgi:hypothetical protein
MMFQRIEPLRDPLINFPWMAVGRRAAVAALDTVERAVTNLRKVLVSHSAPDAASRMPEGLPEARDHRWLH